MLTELQKESLVLNSEDMLVSRIEDYFKKDDAFKLNKDQNYHVGIIEVVGSGLPKEWIGKIVYYHINIAPIIDVKKIGKFELVSNSIKLLIRMDQDINNY